MTRTVRQISKIAARGARGVVVSHNAAAARVGADVLERGGTAFDAAVAMSFVAAVREIPMNGVGGVGVLLAHEGATGLTTEINFYGRTPASLHDDVFVPYLGPPKSAVLQSSYGWRSVQDDRHERGFLSVGVPTYAAGLAELHHRFGTVPWAELLAPAAALAEGGYEPDEEDAAVFAAYLKDLSRFEETARVFLSHGLPRPAAGMTLAQPDLAATIRSLGEHGTGVLYDGPIGERICGYVQKNGGVLDMSDLRRFSPEVNGGLLGHYRGHEIVTSSGMTGGLTLLQMLNLAERIDFGGMDRLSGRCLHQLALIMRQAWTDRYVYVGDPEGTSVPVDGILDKRYAASLRDNILREELSSETEPGDPWAFVAADRSNIPPSGDPGGPDTTHLAAADDDGNVVTLTQTLGLAFGSCVVAPGTGALIYDVTSWMNPVPGTPNSVGPWKKQLGHATPVLIRKDGSPVAALGAPGGRKIVSAMFQVVVNMIDFGMDVQQAIAAPRIHHEGADPSNPLGPTERLVVADDRIPEEALADLQRRGYDVLPVYESATQSWLAKPLGIQFTGDVILGGVDIFRRSVGIGI